MDTDRTLRRARLEAGLSLRFPARHPLRQPFARLAAGATRAAFLCGDDTRIAHLLSR